VLTDIKDQLWKNIFNECLFYDDKDTIKKAARNSKIIKYKRLQNYMFDYSIRTDGFAVSLTFINNNDLDDAIKRKQKMSDARTKSALDKVDLSIEEKANIREANTQKRAEKYIKPKPVPIPKLNKDKTVKKSMHKNLEFQYIDEVDKQELKGKHIYIDPGKRSLLTMLSDDNRLLKYTNGEHMSKTKRLKYAKKIRKYIKLKSIDKIEDKLKGFNSKSCTTSDFKNYAQKKIEISNDLQTLYSDKKFKQYKWYAYINKKRAEDNMLNKIENYYGKDYTIIIGDWSIGKQMAHFISTPNLTLKRKLRERFKVYNIDEFRTSCLHNKTEEVCGHLNLPCYNKKTKEIKNKSMHSILTYQMENTRLGCLDRDINGCLNIKKIFKSYIKIGSIPLRYKRGTDLTMLPTTIEKRSIVVKCTPSVTSLNKAI
jgi:hypothetical protein